ncbi:MULTISPECIES: hypothetical protein [Pseudoalteromonas]|uniref:Uncharacterized protein n=1 Tax=Pseudoalteromonas peptidolytica F12-50-A1 TaxID=1315280 RepID=A0A8I0MZ77_9GAMM|nr:MULTISPECIES: hypothetical protein [Pseudoalteromonas]MBE0347830.1 hypothetical protein [Pseudoalteromonas peptidolytica F12-50-A1]NLR15262.1 hypothetical protein [Pseudoalteromonas peptidolytica]RXF01051.1 hypothetical protein D9603_14210 [Pseudoalteromonas sp. PS5]GEK10797.1 hypothetical protein PPE03_30460 [Pseudoalteromonas peptidolytica]
MANYPIFHGITLANSATFENLVIESLASDPQGASEGRVWYNSAEKQFKASITDEGGALTTIAFQTTQEFTDFLAALASQEAGNSGASKVGYEGKQGSNAKFSAQASTLDNIIGAIIDAVDADKQALADLGAQNAGLGTNKIGYEGKAGGLGEFSIAPTTLKAALDAMVDQIDINKAASKVSSEAIQAELDKTQAAAGLSESGDYTPSTGANYLKSEDFTNASKVPSLAAADELLDDAIKSLTDTVQSNKVAAEQADDLKLNIAGGVMTGALDMGTNPISSAHVPTQPNHLVNLKYIDGMRAGLDVRESVRVATTAPIANLGGDIQDNGDNSYQIDGVTLVSGDRVLIKNSASQNGTDSPSAIYNGIYVVTISEVSDQTTEAKAEFERAIDADGTPDGEVTNGMHTFIEEGATYANAGFVLGTPNPISLETTELTFVQFSGAGQLTAGAGIQKDGNTLFLNFGAGVKESPTDEIGIDFGDGLFTTEDGSTESDASAAKLQIKIDGDTLEKSNAGLKVSATFQDSVNAIANELNATQIAAGLEADGRYIADSETNYLTAVTSLKTADKALDDAIKAVDERLSSESEAHNNARQALQLELDKTQVGTGLELDGSYKQATDSNYLNTATSVHDASLLLDSALKAVSSELVAEKIARENADNAIKQGAGLSADGSMQSVDSYTYIKDTTSLFGAITKLDVEMASELGGVRSNITNVVNQVNDNVYFELSQNKLMQHKIEHNLNSEYVDVMVWVERGEGEDARFYNDITMVKQESDNVVMIYLTEAARVKVSVQAVRKLADPTA